MLSKVVRQAVLNNAAKIINNNNNARCLGNLSRATKEPDSPNIVTSKIPGPKSEQYKKDLDKYQNASAVKMFVDFNKSYGNYLVDIDGNTYLDLYSQISSIPLGYNHPAMIEALQNPNHISSFINRPALGILPPMDFLEMLNQGLLSIAPKGMNEVQTMACGSCSVENALKAAFFWYRNKQRNGDEPTAEDMESCLLNDSPGAPKLSIMSFSGAFHGRTLGALTCTRSKSIHKVDVPAFDWPMADYPIYKYPLNENQQYNRQVDDRCLAKVKALIHEFSSHTPVAGLIIEPIQGEGGDNPGSEYFFQELRKLTLEHGIAMIIDEVQTGCGPTGTFWAHEQFNMSTPPDLMTFSKKMLIGGFFYRGEFRPHQPYRIFNTWLGDPSKLVLLNAAIKVINEEKLLDSIKKTGKVLLTGLENAQKHYPGKVMNARGRGTYCGIDFETSALRDKAIELLHFEGVHCGGSGDKTLRIRTTLTFNEKHANQFLERLDRVLKVL